MRVTITRPLPPRPIVNPPTISVITPTLNRARFLGEAIESVLAQGYANFEHIVVDAVSTDETPVVLARYPHLRVICEPDRGLYDAMNKGLRMARGEFIGLLNSDDLYPPGAFSNAMAASEGVDVVSGGGQVFKDADKSVVREVIEPRETALNLHNVLSGFPLINARFYRRSLVERVGEFDLAYPIAADREWLFRMVLAEPREALVKQLFFRHRQHDESLTFDAAGRNETDYREQHAAFAEKYLAQGSLTAELRRELRRYHARESASVAAAHWKSGRGDRVREWARRGRAQNALWPLWFAKRLAGQMLGL